MSTLWRWALKLLYAAALCYWWVVRPTERGAYVALWCRGRILVIRNSYRSAYTLPAGRLKRSEEPAEGARRELEEEVGVVVSSDRLRRACELVSREEFKTDVSTVFEIELDEEPALHPDGREVAWAAFLDLAEARQLRMTSIVSQYFQWLEGRPPVVEEPQ